MTVIADSDYRIGGDQDYFGLSMEMMGHIGSPDPALRDDLIYNILDNWISRDLMDARQRKHLLEISLDDHHLFYRIGASGDDSVFTRSFSILIVASIINAHRRNGFLSESELRLAKSRIEDYVLREKDVRGYLGEKGWAHAVAHAADALGELAQCSEFTRAEDFTGMLSAIKAKIETDYYAFAHDEDERMVTAMMSIMGRTILDERTIIDWINVFPEIRRIMKYPEDLYLRVNVKTFLRSFYFRLLRYDSTSPVLPVLKEKLFKASRY